MFRCSPGLSKCCFMVHNTFACLGQFRDINAPILKSVCLLKHVLHRCPRSTIAHVRYRKIVSVFTIQMFRCTTSSLCGYRMHTVCRIWDRWGHNWTFHMFSRLLDVNYTQQQHTYIGHISGIIYIFRRDIIKAKSIINMKGCILKYVYPLCEFI